MSGYWIFLLMIIPVIAGVVSWQKFHTIELWESATSVGAALVVIISVFGISQCSLSHDTYTESGRIMSVVHTPKWKAEWTETETYTTTDSKGKSHTHTRLVTRRKTHSPTWVADTTIGSMQITEGYFNYIGRQHGIRKELGYRPDYDSGDRYDYHSTVSDDPEFCDYPVNGTAMWLNPILTQKGLRGYEKLSDNEIQQYGLFDYPNHDKFKSSRLLGGVPLSHWDWDKMNTYLYDQRGVNVLMVKLGSIDTAKKFQQHWKNGRKNDLVLCYGDGWSYVFGWTDKELVKMNLQTILLDNPIDINIIPLIKSEILKNYKPHNWEQYQDDEFVVETWMIVTAFLLMIATQAGLYYKFHKN
jgi:hypothetical protein